MDARPERKTDAGAHSRPLPDGNSGTVALLFTDVEGSTELLLAHPDEMRTALLWHDERLRRVIEENGGHVFKSLGDGFCAAFAAVRSAVSAAIACQRALTEQQDSAVRLRVRIAIHAGSVERRGDDYHGLPLHRAARLLSAGHGGQVLLSEAAGALTEGALPDDARLVRLGRHRLRDLHDAEAVFQLRHPDLSPLERPGFPHGFPPLRTIDTFPHNLPRQLTSFIGRERETTTVTGLVSAASLVTLTGAGGSGKTRLALQAAASLLESFPEGVWLVELAPLTSASLVDQTIASIVGAREESTRAPIDSAAEQVGAKKLLLLLDNCEHVWKAAANAAQRLLQACPNLHILATGRRRLGIRGERTWLVPTLAVPPESDAELDSLRACESVELFVQRAREVRDDFDLTAANAPSVVKICRRLDGIPLALELAAVRTRSLSAQQIADRLDHRFRILVGDDHTAPERQHTLEAMIAWSYDLLSASEHRLLRRLSVFAGGCTLEAAAAICGEPDSDEVEILDALDSLVEHSLVLSDENAHGGRRYRMLETIREYALARLEETADAEISQQRHRDYFLTMAEEAEPHLQQADQKEWLDRLDAEHDNIRAALKWSVDGDYRLRMASALHRYWLMRSLITEGRGWLEGALNRSNGGSLAVRAKAFNALGILAWSVDDYSSARRFFDDALAIRRRLHDEVSAAHVLNNLGMVARATGDFREARRAYSESVGLFRRASNDAGLARVLLNIGNLYLQVDKLDLARRFYSRCRKLLEKSGDVSTLATVLNSLGVVEMKDANPEAAADRFRESIAILADLNDLGGMVDAIQSLAILSCHAARYDASARLFGLAEWMETETRIPPDASSVSDVRDCQSDLREHLSDEELARHWSSLHNASALAIMESVRTPLTSSRPE